MSKFWKALERLPRFGPREFYELGLVAVSVSGVTMVVTMLGLWVFVTARGHFATRHPPHPVPAVAAIVFLVVALSLSLAILVAGLARSSRERKELRSHALDLTQSSTDPDVKRLAQEVLAYLAFPKGGRLRWWWCMFALWASGAFLMFVVKALRP